MLSPENAQHIVDEMKAAIRCDINIMDENGMILASTNPARRGTVHAGARQIIENRLESLTIWEDDARAGVQRGINLPITLDGAVVGVIGITGNPEEVSLFGDIIKRMTEVMLDGTRRQEQSDLIDRAKGLFVENWLFSPAPNLSELETRGRLLGFDIAAPYTVAILQTFPQEESRFQRADDLEEIQNSRFLQLIQLHIGGSDRHFCAVVRSRIIVLLCRSSRDEAYRLIGQICADMRGFHAVDVSGGISSASKDPLDIRRCYLEAHTANTVSAQSARHPILFYDQVSLEFVIQSIPRAIRQDLRQMIFSSCAPEERERLIQTIQLYFAHDGDIKACAQASYVHRNTFQYWMERVSHRTGYHLRIPKQALLLYIAAQESD